MVTHSFPWTAGAPPPPHALTAVRARSGISSDAEVASAAAEPRRSRRRGAAAARGRQQGGGRAAKMRAAVAVAGRRWRGGRAAVAASALALPLPTSARSQDSRVLRPTLPHVVMVPAPQRSARWRALPCTGRGRELARALT